MEWFTILSRFDDIKVINFRKILDPAKKYRLRAIMGDMINTFDKPRSVDDYENPEFTQLMIDWFKLLKKRGGKPSTKSTKSRHRLVFPLNLIFTEVPRQIFSGLVVQQDFNIVSLSDIHNIAFSELFESRKMYKLQTELTIVLYDPKNNSFQERTLYVNIPDHVHQDNMDFVDELVVIMGYRGS